jgi:hypothetical protein
LRQQQCGKSRAIAWEMTPDRARCDQVNRVVSVAHSLTHLPMRSDIRPGGTFPDYSLPDHTKMVRRLSELQGDRWSSHWRGDEGRVHEAAQRARYRWAATKRGPPEIERAFNFLHGPAPATEAPRGQSLLWEWKQTTISARPVLVALGVQRQRRRRLCYQVDPNRRRIFVLNRGRPMPLVGRDQRVTDRNTENAPEFLRAMTIPSGCSLGAPPKIRSASFGYYESKLSASEATVPSGTSRGTTTEPHLMVVHETDVTSRNHQC